MMFSEAFRQTNQLCYFSPNGKYLANAAQYRLIIRDVATFQIAKLFTCLDAIQQIEWSPDSEFILCAMHKRGLVQVWSMEQPEWKCKIDEGSIGLVNATWSPDSRHILTTAEFILRITVWSLTDKKVFFIKYPKPCQKGMASTPDGKYLALAERRNCKDYVSIFNCHHWCLMENFETDTEDLDGIEWSPDGRVLAVWESCLNYKVSLYYMNGKRLSTFSAYKNALGIKSFCWSNSSQFLAIGSYDQKVRILNHLTWKQIVEYDHPATKDDVVGYREVINRPPSRDGDAHQSPGVDFGTKSRYALIEGPVRITCTKPALNKAFPRIGIGLLTFCPNSRYIASRNDNMPTALWIWDVQRLKFVAVLVQDTPINSVVWDPRQSRLALSSGTNKIYMWSPVGCLAVDVPIEGAFTVQKLRWSPDGNSLIIIGRDHMCVSFLTGANSTEGVPMGDVDK